MGGASAKVWHRHGIALEQGMGGIDTAWKGIGEGGMPAHAQHRVHSTYNAHTADHSWHVPPWRHLLLRRSFACICRRCAGLGQKEMHLAEHFDNKYRYP